MADSDATPPPLEVETEEPIIESSPAREETASAPAAVAPTQEEAAASEPPAAAEGEAEGDHKRKLDEVEANDAGEDAKRPRVEGDAAGTVEQSNESSEKIQEPAAVSVEGVADAENGKLASTDDLQTGSHDKLLEPAAEAVSEGLPAQQEGATEETTRTIDVPNNKVGVLIGKAGETIRSLQISSGAKIQITKDADVDAEAVTRSVELVGTLESIDKADLLIKNVIAEAEAGGSPALIAKGFGAGQPGSEQFEMLVPDNKVGLIIGKGGETIKNLQTRSGARIQLIPQHPPPGTSLTERTVRVTGNKKQIEAAKELIKQAMSQTFPRHSAQSGGYGLQHQRPQGHGPASQWGPRSQPQPGYGYPPRGPPQNAPYSQPPFGGFPQQPPPRGGMGWDHRPPPHSSHQGGGYDYYKQGSQPYDSQPPNYPPGPGNYNSYGPPQAPSYGQPQYPQSAPQQNYGPGYGDPRYSAPAPTQQYYGQPPAGPQQGYPQQSDPYARPAYGGPGQWPPRGTPAGDGSYQAPPPTSYAPPAQQPPAYGQAYGPTTGPDGYAQQGYPQQAGQAPPTYPQSAPAGPGYNQQGGYQQYPPSQPAYGDQAAQNNASYGYQGGPADPSYGNAYPQSGYGPTPASGQAGYAAAPAASQPGYAQAGYTQPPANPPSYDQSAPTAAAAAAAQSGYAAPAANPQPAAAKGVSPQPAAGYGGQWTA